MLLPTKHRRSSACCLPVVVLVNMSSPPGMLFWIVLTGLIAVSAGVDCTGQPDGIYEYSCFFYVVCAQGVAIEIRCNDTDVFDPDVMQCVTPEIGYWPCNDVEDCSSKADSRYPDFTNGCKSYYTCYNGFFYGHNYCPQGTVFDPIKQLCNWPDGVRPPCGTCTSC